MREINVIYQFNEKYVPYAGVSMTSLLVNNKDADEINIYVLGEGLSSEAKGKLERAVAKFNRRILFPETEGLIEKFKTLGMIPYRGAYSVYLRLFFTELIDIKGRALYLDSDTIVDGSLIPLIEYDLDGKSVGMVLESIRDNYKVMIGMGEMSDYYNSGVILFDVDKWKENRYCDKIVEHIRNVRSSYIGDQDFLNIVCEGDVCRLPVKYNFQPLHGRYNLKQYSSVYGMNGYYSKHDIEESRSSAIIYHCYRWLGEFPWDKGNLHPFGEVFDRYLSQSEWCDYVKLNADTGFILKVEKLLYRLLPKSIFIWIFKRVHEIMLKKAEEDARLQKTNERA